MKHREQDRETTIDPDVTMLELWLGSAADDECTDLIECLVDAADAQALRP